MALLEEIERTDGQLTGVIHGAGLTRDGLLLNKDDATLREVLAPKVTGLRVLDDALGDRALEFFVLFASAAGALGNPGQSDYAAANAFLDRYALERNTRVGAGTRQGRTVSIDWPYWREGGMKMDARTMEAMEREAGVRPLETGPGLAALEAVLAGNEDQVLVLEGDRDRLRRILQPVRPDPLLRPTPAARRVDEVRRSEPEALPADRDELVALIRSCFSRCLGIPQDKLGMDDTIDRFGVDSVSALEIVEALEEIFGPLPQTILFEVPTIGQLADELIARGVAPASYRPRSAPSEQEPASVRLSATSGGERRNPEIDGIAIIAVEGRYPGAATIEAFSALLREGRDAITEIPPDRAHLLPRFSERKGEPDSSYCKWGGFLADVDRFDAEFFGYTPRAADLADPQERLFLETSWHLLERAGITRKRLAEQYDKRVGVFVGSMYQQYSGVRNDVETRKLLALSSYSGIANRVSFFLDLQGPSVAVDSMCSSGLQAVHQACQSLKSGECRLAIAGGVNLTIHPAKFEALSRAGLVGSHPGSRAFSGGTAIFRPRPSAPYC
ncbi:beta-ketoacyl synthase N-terminal-like domain-containing protein [Roseibium salinum]|nr:beta-ketoacyl synthase N-terminal-like domain-containing protein [Roseibium salinum]